MPVDFDHVIDRNNSNSMKWDCCGSRLGLSDPDILPMWVADMDFPPPPAVNQAIADSVTHSVHGYFGDETAFYDAICAWMKARHNWHVDPDWITTTHGLVAGIGIAIQAFSKPGDGVAIFAPVYHSFARTIKAAGRTLIESPLRQVQGRYHMNFDDLESRIDSDTRILLFCSPHNPGGRVWSVEELQELGAFCETHDLILISDEIHHDLVFEGHRHTVMANACPNLTHRLVMMSAATKTFNIAGALMGNVTIADPALRKTYRDTITGLGCSTLNRFGVLAATAAYRDGADWVDALLPYIAANRDHFETAITRILPGVRMMPLDSTYLAWVDFSGLGWTTQQAADFVQGEAKIAVNLGPQFGMGGEGWLRFNLACPRATVDEAIRRLDSAYAARR